MRGRGIPPRSALVAILVATSAAAGLAGADQRRGNAAEEATFRRRAEFITDQTAAIDLDAMRVWFDATPYFQDGGGDPHKYALPGVIARLSRDPTDPAALRMARHLAAVDLRKGDRGLYHFAAFQRARLFLGYPEALPEDLRTATIHDVRHHYPILRGGGTENHHFMHRCSGYILAERVPGPYAGRTTREEHLAWQRDWLREQVRRLYTIGMGEYDSSTYVAYTLASWANVHDFTADPQMRLLARAALDWYCVALARKYFHGCQLGPESRGFAREAVGTTRDQAPRRPGSTHFAHAATGSSADWACWLYWGDSQGRVAMDEADVEAVSMPVNVLALSGYRPHPVIRRIARKEVALPYEARGSKPAYSGEGDNKDHEYLYVDRAFAMATLYSPEKGQRTSGTILPQTTMFKLLLRDAAGIHAFGMANGYHGHFPLEGRSPYDQYHQQGAAALDVCFVPAEEDERTRQRSICGFPTAAGDPLIHDGWYGWQVGGGYVAARPLNGQAQEQDNAAVHLEEPREASGHRWLVSPGRLSGWVVQVGQAPEHASLAAFLEAVARRCVLDLTAFDERQRTVVFTSLAGDVLRLRHSGGPGGLPEASSNGQALSFTGQPVYASPWVHQELRSGILRLHDGHEELVIDCSGDWPVYRE